MNKKITVLLVAVLCLSVSLTACSNKDSKTDEKEATETTEKVEAEVDGKKDEEKVEKEEKEKKEEADVESSEKKKESKEAKEEKTDSEAAKAEGEFLNLDNMNFMVNGKTYTLGKTTLQEMIDDGVPFREESLSNAKNNLNAASQSPLFKIALGEYWNVQVFFLNDTDSDKPITECYVNEIAYNTVEDLTQDIVTFDFPLDITMDMLKEKAGEPTKTNHFDGDNGYYTDEFEYTRPGTKFYGDNGYKFQFTRGELSYVYIKYIP